MLTRFRILLRACDQGVALPPENTEPLFRSRRQDPRIRETILAIYKVIRYTEINGKNRCDL